VQDVGAEILQVGFYSAERGVERPVWSAWIPGAGCESACSFIVESFYPIFLIFPVVLPKAANANFEPGFIQAAAQFDRVASRPAALYPEPVDDLDHPNP
jgi:hypothetical protein